MKLWESEKMVPGGSNGFQDGWCEEGFEGAYMCFSLAPWILDNKSRVWLVAHNRPSNDRVEITRINENEDDVFYVDGERVYACCYLIEKFLKTGKKTLYVECWQ